MTLTQDLRGDCTCVNAAQRIGCPNSTQHCLVFHRAANLIDRLFSVLVVALRFEEPEAPIYPVVKSALRDIILLEGYPIRTAPKDGTTILVYAPPYEGLDFIVCECSYHPDAGFCIDELRQPELWMPLI